MSTPTQEMLDLKRWAVVWPDGVARYGTDGTDGTDGTKVSPKVNPKHLLHHKLLWFKAARAMALELGPGAGVQFYPVTERCRKEMAEHARKAFHAEEIAQARYHKGLRAEIKRLGLPPLPPRPARIPRRHSLEELMAIEWTPEELAYTEALRAREKALEPFHDAWSQQMAAEREAEAETEEIEAELSTTSSEMTTDTDESEMPVAAALREKIAMRLAYTATDLVTEREVEFYVEGLIGAELAGGLVSTGGTGKTALLINLGIATALGATWLGRKVTQGTFVLLSLDDAQEDLDGALARELNAMQLPAHQVELVRRRVLLISMRDIEGEVKFATSGYGTVEATTLADQLLAGLEDLTDIRCIALDTLRQFAGGTTNDDRVMTIATKAVTRMAQHIGCAAIVPAHTTKAGAREGVSDQYAAAGSGAFGDNLRFILVLQRVEREEVEREVHLDSTSRFALLDAEQVLRMDDTRGSLLRRATGSTYILRSGYSFRPLDAPVKTAGEKVSEAEAKATLAALELAETGELNRRALQDRTKCRNGPAGETIARLEAMGLLERKSRTAKPTLTEVGRHHLQELRSGG